MRTAVVCFAVCLMPLAAKAEVTVTLDSVTVGKAGDARLEIRISGPEMSEATDHKTPVVTVATDDTGLSVLHEVKRPVPNNYQSIMRMPMEMDSKGKLVPARSDLVLPLAFKAAAPGAKSLALVKGSVALRVGGDKTPVTVANVKSVIGKDIASPRLAAANLKVKVLPPEDENNLMLEITGSGAPLKGIKVLNPAGKNVSNGYHGQGAKGVMVFRVMLTEPLDGTMSLRLELLTDQKEIEVPFEFKDVKLANAAAKKR